MRRFLSLYGMNLILSIGTALIAALVYMTFPDDGYSAGPLLVVIIAAALVAAAVWAFWPKPYEWYHVLGGFCLGVAATLVVLFGGLATGWGSIGVATALVVMVLVWIGVVTLIDHKISTGRWIG